MNTPTLGTVYAATMPETKLCKNRGGYYGGYRRVATGKTVSVTCRADSECGGFYWGEWVEVCGARRSVRNQFTQQMFSQLAVES